MKSTFTERKYWKIVPDAMRGLQAMGRYLVTTQLDSKLLGLVRLRASQINGCAPCIDLHSKDGRTLGEREQGLYELNAWREMPFYSPSERSVLAWTEAVTLVTDEGVPDEVYNEAREYFSETDLANITLAIGMINLWNRLCISLCAMPGGQEPAEERIMHQE